eukprot:COSAG06_NODE_2079_length_7643_cov_20.586957_9_plen_106_part_00
MRVDRCTGADAAFHTAVLRALPRADFGAGQSKEQISNGKGPLTRRRAAPLLPGCSCPPRRHPPRHSTGDFLNVDLYCNSRDGCAAAPHSPRRRRSTHRIAYMLWW